MPFGNASNGLERIQVRTDDKVPGGLELLLGGKPVQRCTGFVIEGHAHDAVKVTLYLEPDVDIDVQAKVERSS
jgi:hypothetical protein